MLSIENDVNLEKWTYFVIPVYVRLIGWKFKLSSNVSLEPSFQRAKNIR